LEQLMMNPSDPQAAPAYTTASVMAYLRAAEAECQRIRKAIAEARHRAEVAQHKAERLRSLDSGIVPVVSSGPRGVVPPVDGAPQPAGSDRGGAASVDPGATRELAVNRGPEVVLVLDQLMQSIRSSLVDDGSERLHVDPAVAVAP
jgi:hypothetical protein